ncbi:hypothetical protein BASA81_001375 [Batrachochytrium salamandrivorans]|nr:hypothetical protein BASA81_001375 [Batrachochytrium salamandrivorans]
MGTPLLLQNESLQALVVACVVTYVGKAGVYPALEFTPMRRFDSVCYSNDSIEEYVKLAVAEAWTEWGNRSGQLARISACLFGAGENGPLLQRLDFEFVGGYPSSCDSGGAKLLSSLLRVTGSRSGQEPAADDDHCAHSRGGRW